MFVQYAVVLLIFDFLFVIQQVNLHLQMLFEEVKATSENIFSLEICMLLSFFLLKEKGPLLPQSIVARGMQIFNLIKFHVMLQNQVNSSSDEISKNSIA